MDKSFSYCQFFIGLAAMLISLGVAYGVIQNRISNIEDNLSTFRSDHDILIRICANLETVQKDVQEIKKDVKTHLNEHK